MHRALAAAAVLFLPAAAPAQKTAAAAKQFGWLDDYPAAVAAAKRTGKPIFLVFRCEP